MASTSNLALRNFMAQKKYEPVPDKLTALLDDDLPRGLNWDGNNDGSITMSAENRDYEKALDNFIAQMQKKFPGLKAESVGGSKLDFKLHMGPKKGKTAAEELDEEADKMAAQLLSTGKKAAPEAGSQEEKAKMYAKGYRYIIQ